MKKNNNARDTAEFMVEVLSDDLELLNEGDMIETSNELVEMATEESWKDRRLIIDTLVYLLRVSARVLRDPSYKPLALPSTFVAMAPRALPTKTSKRKRPPRR